MNWIAPTTTDDCDFRVIEMRIGYAVQDVHDAYIYDERFLTRIEAEAWIEKRRYQVH